MENPITTVGLVDDLVLKVYEDIDFDDVSSKENHDKINIVMKGVEFLSNEDKHVDDVEASVRDSEIEEKKIASNERIRMSEIEAGKKERILRYLEAGVKGAGVLISLIDIIARVADGKAQRKSDLDLAKMNLDFKKQSDIESRNFIDEQNLKSYIFEETGTARSTANKRTEKLLDTYSKKLNEYK